MSADTSADRPLHTPAGSSEGSDPNDPDGQMDDQDMPTTDGQMASNTSEEVIPPRE
jgi:hypothetical protein